MFEIAPKKEYSGEIYGNVLITFSLSIVALYFARQEYQERLAEIDAWQSLSETTDFD